MNPNPKGQDLRDVWDDLIELRSIKGTFIDSVDGTYCEDPVFCAELGGFSPYKTEAEFNEGLIRAMNLSQQNTRVDHVTRLVRALPKHEIVLTHADFSPRNILIRGDKVVAILDWEMAGFYPAYWEYIKAMYHPDWQSGWIKDGAVEKNYDLTTLSMRFCYTCRKSSSDRKYRYYCLFNGLKINFIWKISNITQYKKDKNKNKRKTDREAPKTVHRAMSPASSRHKFHCLRFPPIITRHAMYRAPHHISDNLNLTTDRPRFHTHYRLLDYELDENIIRLQALSP
uniref:Aminoglycoside phosphotransferase domain-containing protein n=1 Tax=Coccidioides posadasii RMSCC 3488 TaxID=454284 RepID=A0A0J6FH52_COCPO|nr:hypothetical protein CPAG_05918 [Coccidioides posadasii RMSCC 3488]